MSWKLRCGICHYCPMANNEIPEVPGAPVKLPSDDGPPFPPAHIPTEPAELDTWREEYVRDLVDHYPGGIGAPWRK